MEYNLMNALSRETTMRTYLNEIKNKYDYILIDCMPIAWVWFPLMPYLRQTAWLSQFRRSIFRLRE